MRYRIKTKDFFVTDGFDTWYIVQEKQWFFWRTIKLFYYREDAEEYIRSKQ